VIGTHLARSSCITRPQAAGPSAKADLDVGLIRALHCAVRQKHEATPSPRELTQLLTAWRDGDEAARDRLLSIVYEDLQRRAAAHLRRDRRGHSLRPTDLVHETYLRLCGARVAWESRGQFFGVASRLMRQILVDHARARAAAKRGRGLRVTLAEELASSPPVEPEFLDVDRALDELAALDDRQARLVELRYFGGLTIEETAALLEISVATANREWATAKMWLYRRLKGMARPEPGESR
jgi:RNA polymerase sigma factor (TIGR02999 family)